jgi:hypothetical protein
MEANSATFFHHDYLGREWIEGDGAGYIFLCKYMCLPNADDSKLCHFHDLALHNKVTADTQGKLNSLDVYQNLNDEETPYEPASETSHTTLDVYHAFQDTRTRSQVLDNVEPINFDLLAEDFVMSSGSGLGSISHSGKDAYKTALEAMYPGHVAHHDYLSEWQEADGTAYLFVSVYAVFSKSDGTKCHHHDYALHKVTLNEQGQMKTLEYMQKAAKWIECTGKWIECTTAAAGNDEV